MDFTKTLTSWYLHNKRDLPWRNTNDPYPIWLSEIILQQTRVAQGLPYFYNFIEAFPTIFDLANASEQQVLKLWQGLGYYSRARNLHFTAKYIAFDLNGKFPDNYIDLLKLKGIGEYTAAAIASFSYNEPIAVVDGNVFRVLSRVFNVYDDIADSKTKKIFFELSQTLLPINNPALYNQAIMEFGALQCVPKNPNCEICPMNTICIANKEKTVSTLPVKSKKVKVKNRYLNYLIIKDEKNHILYEKRIQKDIWQNLYQFPLYETQEKLEYKNLLDFLKESNLFKNKINNITINSSKDVIHKLTHQKLFITFIVIETEGLLKNAINYTDFSKLPLPIVINNYISNNLM